MEPLTLLVLLVCEAIFGEKGNCIASPPFSFTQQFIFKKLHVVNNKLTNRSVCTCFRKRLLAEQFLSNHATSKQLRLVLKMFRLQS